MRTLVSCLGAALVCVVIIPGTAAAQSAIAGIVKDASGAVLPGVEVTATQTATGLARSVMTNETGAYTLANLPIGPYQLEAVLPGFRAFSQTGIVLQVGDRPEINVPLQVGAVSENIEVSAGAAMVQTEQTLDNLDKLLRQLRGHWLLGGRRTDAQQESSRRLPALEITP